MWLALALALTVTPGVVAASAAAEEHIARGERALANLDFDLAADELTLAAGDATADDEQRMRANLLAGLANRIAGRETEARLSFRYVLLRAPDTRPPDDWPPKVVAFFELVRQEVDAERAKAAPLPPPVVRAEPAPVEAAPVDDGAPVALWVAGAGSAVALVGGALAVAAEVSLGDVDSALDERRQWRAVGIVGLSTLALGAATGVVGGALWVTE